MAHDVRARQAADGDVVNAVEDADGLLEAGRLVRRQVDLRHVAGDDNVRAEADARQEHLHLLAGGVLRLVEDDEAVVERAAAHIRQRRDLDVAALEILRVGVRAEHLEERVVQRTQVGVDLVLQVAGQKAQPLARLDRRAREDDAVDALGTKRRDRLRHGEVCLTGAGGADAERDRVLLDGVQICALAERLCLDGLALGRDAHHVARKLLDLLLPALAHEAEDVAHVLLADLLALGRQRQQAGDGLFGIEHVLGLAGDVDLLVAIGHAHIVFGLDHPQVLVKRAEHADDVLHSVDFHGFFNHLL